MVVAGCASPSACGGLFGPGSCGSTIEFAGSRHTGMSAEDLEIEEADLDLIGTADSVTSAVGGPEVYALEGVSPDNLVVMRTPEGSDPAYIIYRPGELEYSAALCEYFRDPPAECR
jgi:hypothetical protein